MQARRKRGGRLRSGNRRILCPVFDRYPGASTHATAYSGAMASPSASSCSMRRAAFSRAAAPNTLATFIFAGAVFVPSSPPSSPSQSCSPPAPRLPSIRPVQDELPELLGSWLVTTTTVTQDVVFPALLTFTGDGILLADEPPALYETTGHGAWAAVEAPKAAAEASSAMLGPGAKVGEMVLSQGPEPFDLDIPTYVAFCNGNPMLEEGSNVGKAGVYTVECSVPVLLQFMIGFGWVTDTKEHLDEQWSAISTELYLNGKQVDQAAFGSIDAALPVGAIPGEDADKVVELPMRAWKVMLENLQAGPLELHFIWNVAKDVSDSMTTTPAGIYDITYKITADPALAAPEGEPAPVTFVPE